MHTNLLVLEVLHYFQVLHLHSFPLLTLLLV